MILLIQVAPTHNQLLEVNTMRRKRVDVDSLWLRANPTEQDAVAATGSAAASPPKQFVPPSDREWLPQLYATYKSVPAVARIASLGVRECRRKLLEFGVDVKTHDRHKAS